VDAPYAPQDEGGVLWNDPALGIAWPEFAGAVVSGRDAEWGTLAALETPFG
jgi:dTDP-4-dehydrorhamnose 3,5-epimerase